MRIHTGEKPYECCYDIDIENKSSLMACYKDIDIDNKVESISEFSPFSSHLTKEICIDKINWSFTVLSSVLLIFPIDNS